MNRILPLVAVLFAWGVSTRVVAADAGPAASLPAPAGRHVDFVKDLKPLFEASCIQCHAKGKDKGGFSLETREALLKGGDSGPAAVPGKSGESHIVALVAGTDPDSVMPKKGKKWSAEQVGLLRAWIDQGADWPAGVTFAKPEPLNLMPHPATVPSSEDGQPADRILAAYFASKGITPESVVDDRVFARRVYLDTIGLLPTPEQLAEFVADDSPGKRQRLVRRLLDDRRGYADHWLTFWNDLLRNDYRGTGFIDGGRRQISGWLYSALVENRRFDQFVAELVNPVQSSEGFSRGIVWRGTVNASQLPPMQAAQNVSQVFMGVNLKCASCHDSFVNDWTLADAYGLAAVFSDERLELVHCDKPTGKTAAVRFLYPQLGQMGDMPRPERLKRLAELMIGRNNGRLSRTIVNRLWQRLLGRGLVEPVDDMDRPAWSADLLDWLAEDLVAHDYDLKHTIEVILTSRAYQLPSVEPPAAASTPAGKAEYVFRGPQPRRLTAEQFTDALTSFTNDWARLPATLDVDFTAGGSIGKIKAAVWVWTDEPVEDGQRRWHEQYARGKHRKEMDAEYALRPDRDGYRPLDVPHLGDPPEADEQEKQKSEADQLARHRVVFRKGFTLDRVPDEAFAALSASQGFSLSVNGKPAPLTILDQDHNARVALYDLKKNLTAGDNVIVIDVSSHTEKRLNDAERLQFPQSLHHLNRVSGVALYLRASFGKRKTAESMELTTDDTWRVRRAPDGKWREPAYGDTAWVAARPLPAGVTPVDEGPALPPIARKDFANEPVELAPPFWTAETTAAQPGHIRASLVAADPLMTALDRPNREQVMTVRSTAATTLQALELTNGAMLDGRLKKIAQKLTSDAAKDPAGWVTGIYRHGLSRDPTPDELRFAREVLGGEKVNAEGVADFLWAVTQLPEFQFIQ